LKLKCEKPLSILASNFNLRRYNKADTVEERALKDAVFSFLVITEDMAGNAVEHAVGRCCLTVSKPVLEAPRVSELDIGI